MLSKKTRSMTSLLTLLNTILPLSPKLSNATLAGTVRGALPAHHCQLRPDEVARQVYFLESGLVRGYTLVHGREISSWFMQAGDLVISLWSAKALKARNQAQIHEALREVAGY